ncbi:MAG: pyruvate,orthophosphate dikinase [bacterium]|jgi:pyruvate,orthophosphate dikinase
MTKRVYLFNEGNKNDGATLGGKGANLCEMTSLGLPVPFGFIITTSTCLEFFKNGNTLPQALKAEYTAAVHRVEDKMRAKFGDPSNPLLFSVRSGAPVSMPGMMDTVLNLGMNDEIVEGLAKKTNNPRFAYDAYRRFIQMFSDVVMGKDHHEFEAILEAVKEEKGAINDTDLTADDLKELVRRFKEISHVPSDPYVQLEMAIKAVFSSWYNPRADYYRQMHDISIDLGTAVSIQSMVFGNFGDTSGSGVAFTRNPSTGEKIFYGEHLRNAAGEDVVAGIRTPESLDVLKKEDPIIYGQLYQIQRQLEQHYQDMQDIEFTIQEEELYILQTRNGKRTGRAAVKIAVDMVNEGLITEEEALLRVDTEQLDFFLHPVIDPDAEKNVIARGLPASPGGATGKVVFTADEAEAEAEKGEKVILVRKETTPEDIHGMKAAEGILTALGGMTSHAAVVARGMGKCAISGCSDISIDHATETFETKDGTVYKKGDIITLDGSAGEVIIGEVAMIEARSDSDFQQILDWSDKHRRLKVRANAETPDDAKKALELGAEGIGLCRTEHMFFDADRIDVMRSMILSDTKEERQKYLDQLFEFQKTDMKTLFSVMTGHHVTIRLLDPPLHEFLPHGDAEIEALAGRLNKDVNVIKKRIDELGEANPMLGFRGCRLAIVYPEIAKMQAKAIITAALEVEAKGLKAEPEIMVPLVSTVREIKTIVPEIKKTIQEVFQKHGKEVSYRIGTMMEVPRACLMADTIAPEVEFMSFGTNDLTQMTLGFSRDDIGKFLPSYLKHKIYDSDPFAVLDQNGVGRLIKQTIKDSIEANPNLDFGICGEHGGDPKSVKFFHKAGFNYVSCSPFRVPIARIAAAQASVEEKLA